MAEHVNHRIPSIPPPVYSLPIEPIPNPNPNPTTTTTTTTTTEPPPQSESKQPPEIGVVAQPPPNGPASVVPVSGIPKVTPLNRLGELPQSIDCPFCKQMTKTRVQKTDSAKTNICALLCCLICICLACLPHLMEMAQDIDHYCTNCGARVAHKPHGGPIQVQLPQEDGLIPSKYAAVENPDR